MGLLQFHKLHYRKWSNRHPLRPTRSWLRFWTAVANIRRLRNRLLPNLDGKKWPHLRTVLLPGNHGSCVRTSGLHFIGVSSVFLPIYWYVPAFLHLHFAILKLNCSNGFVQRGGRRHCHKGGGTSNRN